MRCKVTGMGVQLSYPLGPKGPMRMLRQYVIEAEDGRVGTLEEWDEPETPTGEYDLPESVLDSVFNKEVELEEEEW